MAREEKEKPEKKASEIKKSNLKKRTSRFNISVSLAGLTDKK